MNVIETISAYREWWFRHRQQTIGLVPTMGYLHQGHISLIEQARRENRQVVLSIFVNPLQFGPSEDFERYPRDMERDLALAERAGVDIVFAPSVHEMYPNPMKTTVEVKDITSRLCGASRPGHFAGVTTVVSKLFHIIQPDKAYFGQKDAQQAAVIEKMIADLNFPVQLVRCPIIREEDGLAMSSRNVYLSPEERREAAVLYESIRAVEGAFKQGEDDAARLLEIGERILHTAKLARIDYAEILSYPDLEPVTALKRGQWIYAVAVFFGNTRLIDNAILQR
jgi:pantoate--beta-alanine ligase